MRRSLLLGCAISALALNACSAIDGFDKPVIAAKPTPSRLDEIAFINVLRSAFQKIPANSTTDDNRSKSKPLGGRPAIFQQDEGEAGGVNAEVGEGDDDQNINNGPERVSIEDLQSAILASSGLCFDGEGLERFKSKLGDGLDISDGNEEFLKGQSRNGNGNEAACITYKAYQRPDFSEGAINSAENQKSLLQMQTYLAAGFGLTDLYCNRFFTTASAGTQNRQFSQDLNTGVDTLVGAVLGLSGAGSTALGITNSAFGLLGDGIQAFDAAYLVAPDLGAVRELIEASQAEYRKPFFVGTPEQMDEYFPRSYPAARAIIERYASQCSFTGMRQLITKSVGDKTERIKKGLEVERPDRVKGDKNRGSKDNVVSQNDGTEQIVTDAMPIAITDESKDKASEVPTIPVEIETRVLSVPIG